VTPAEHVGEIVLPTVQAFRYALLSTSSRRA
jgi:hypothetical protein